MGFLSRLFKRKSTDVIASTGSGVSPPGGRTFSVASVTPATEPMPVDPYHKAVTDFLGGQVESCSSYHGQLVAGVRSHP